MQENTETTKITSCCPTGHRVRGDISFAGNTVRCPKCQAAFVFAPVKPTPVKQAPLAGPRATVTDTGVMRILGETPDLPEPPSHPEVSRRECPRCKVSISVNATVCNHCNCYVGVMPRFMSQLTGGDAGSIGTN